MSRDYAEELRRLTDAELQAIVAELEERAELFDTRTRSIINDELRRRRMPTVSGPRRW